MKIYIGRASNLKRRCWNHLNDLKRGMHTNRYLQRAYEKYGKTNLIFEVIQECSKEKLYELENYFIKFYQSYREEFGFNLVPPLKAYFISDKTREKLRIAASGPNSGMYGKKHSEQAKLKMRQNNFFNRGGISPLIGKKWSKEKSINISKLRTPSFYLLDSKGKSIFVDVMVKFIKENRLTHSAVLRVLRGVKHSCRGFRKMPDGKTSVTVSEFQQILEREKQLKMSRTGKKYTFFNDKNKFIEITNLKKFCKIHNLDYESMRMVYHKKGGRKSHQGYTSAKSFIRDKTEYNQRPPIYYHSA